MSWSMCKVEERLVATKGAELYTASFFHPRPRAIIIVAHSLTQSIGQYATVVQALWDEEFSVYLYNWRQQIHSKCPPECFGRTTPVKDAIDDFALVLEQAKVREARMSTFVVALDEGAAICISYCSTRSPSLLDGVVLFTPSLLPPAAPPSCAEWQLILLETFLPRWKLKVLRKGLRRTMPLWQYRLCFDLALHTQEMLQDVHIPMLVLHGTDDDIEQMECSKRTISEARSTNKTFTVVEGNTEELWTGQMTSRGLQMVQCIVEWIKKRL